MCCDGCCFALVKDTAAGLQHCCHMRCPALCGWQGLGTEIRVLFPKSLSLPGERGVSRDTLSRSLSVSASGDEDKGSLCWFLEFQVQILEARTCLSHTGVKDLVYMP